MSAMYESPKIYKKAFINDSRSFFEEKEVANVDFNLFLGDLNIDINEESQVVYDYKLAFSEFGFHLLIKPVSRGLSISCIDHVFVKPPNPESLLPLK
ncbi:hypothetical protein WA026_012601 [Henosepilachna vigintioctopunctata]|uniref:Uncharacterized protein n=1 Tax=Henosepilachna vigintioctopunctata TaxID=420089 RepID=A0AAW1U6J6_9CUCU